MNNFQHFTDSHENYSIQSSLKIIVANFNLKKPNEIFLGGDINFNELSDAIKIVNIFCFFFRTVIF